LTGLTGRLAQIVVVDDNPADVFLIEEALRTQGIQCHLTRFEDGEQALSALCRGGIERGECPLPDLIFLDLNMPRAEGIDILKAIRQNAQLASTPVAVLSSSESPKDQKNVESMGATRFVRKLTDLQAFLQTVGTAAKELLGSD
jgi:chemotaxis family two-component system response regulator Rcp1